MEDGLEKILKNAGRTEMKMREKMIGVEDRNWRFNPAMIDASVIF